MKSKLEIVKELHTEHILRHKDIVEDCPFCDRKHEEARYMLTDTYQEDLLRIVEKHFKKWEDNGVLMANGLGKHRLAGEIVMGILYKWVMAPEVEIEDFPEEYINHERVLDLYLNQKK